MKNWVTRFNNGTSESWNTVFLRKKSAFEILVSSPKMPKNVSSVLHFCSAIVVLTLNLMAWSVINTKKRELKVLFFSYQIIFFIPIYSQKKCLLYMLFIRCKSYAAVMFIIILCICISLFCWKFTYLPYWTYCSSY